MTQLQEDGDARKLTFGNRKYNLTVYEQRLDGEWLVNSWDVND